MLKRLLILLLLIPAAMAAAQQDRDAGEPEPLAGEAVPEEAAADEDDANDAAGAESASRMEQLPERFDPSEQLSEDLSTAFPVDI